MKLPTILTCAALVFTTPFFLAAQDAREPIATVEGQPIYEQDLMAVAGEHLFDLHNQEYKLKSEALDTLVRKKLIEAEAKKRGLTPDELLKREVDSKIPEPSDDEAKGYFLAAQNQAALSFETIKPQVKQFIKNAEIQRARKQYEDLLRAKADVSILLRPPSVQVAYDAARVEGSPNAPVTIVEFGDFQCPFCKKTEATLKGLLAKYDGRVKLAFLDFPLTEIHGQAEKAAEAARCAGEQAKFWEYHDSLFAEQSKLDEASLIGRAQNLHLDESSFRSCLASGKFKQDIQANREEGTKAGVTGTPAYFINGAFLSGAQPQAEFEKIIDSELAVAHSKAERLP
ncbi:MAG TPA: thioredoxin domain-containing protein [Bryobacteraceae bacterium]|nr:thioredoxin domain-containing protein [Bryobacteraceae bacterium]